MKKTTCFKDAHPTMVPTLLVLALLACISAPVHSQNPGLQIRFAQHGVDRAAQLVLDQLARDVQGYRFPDVSGRASGFRYSVTGMSITRFTKPSSRVTMTPGLGITWTASGAGLRVNGRWRYEKKIAFIRLRDSGSFEMTGSGISFSISVRMGSNSQGRPTISVTRCTSRIGSLSVRIRGSWLSWLYNLFRGRITRALKGPAERKMCEAARKAINTDLNKQLAELKVVNTIDNKFVFDYRLLRAPTFGAGYVQTMQKGEVRSRTSPVPFRAAPTPFPQPSGPSKMVYIWGSDYVINSFAFTAFKMGLARYTYSSKDLSSRERGFLRTTCSDSDICLGSLFPALATMFPNRHVTMVLRASRAPYITTTPRGINLTLPGEVSVNVTSAAGQTDPILKIRLNINLTVTVRLDGRFVKGSVTNFMPEFTVLESAIPEISTTFLQRIYDQLIKPFLLEKLNELGQGGIEVPNLKQVNFIRPVVKLNMGSVMFGTDLDWRSLIPPRIVRPPTRRPPTRRPPTRRPPTYRPPIRCRRPPCRDILERAEP